MNRFCIILFLCSILACKERAKVDSSITEYLPEGVERSEHRSFHPTGESFQGQRIEPPFWWQDLPLDTFELLIYDKNISQDSILSEYPGLRIGKIHRVENPNYLFLDLHFDSGIMPGTVSFHRYAGGTPVKSYSWEIKGRDHRPGRIEPLNPADFLYLIMPDRFANGDTSNDSFEDMMQTGIDRKKVYFRHGGDLQGIIDRLDYFQELGVTAIWLNPALENDQPYASYHGYANTDHYRIDPRYGTNELYKALSDSLQARKMKLVMDIVPNHCGDYHWFIQDIPDKDWIHQFDSFTRSSHAKAALLDPYSLEEDVRGLTDGWFDYSMPDINQQHPRVWRYLLQNYIWWIEYAGLDALRIDTYPYADIEWMTELSRQVKAIYPGFHLFGEIWLDDPALLAPFAGGNEVKGLDTHLPAVMDFPLTWALHKALTEETTWTGGVYHLSNVLAQDFLYPAPSLNVTFLDNHDMSRIYSIVGKDLDLMKSAATLLLTLRGIPCLYYGTEILMEGFSDPDGLVRKDFMGGWQSDVENKFNVEGRTYDEMEMFNHIKKLGRLRKTHPGLFTGEMRQRAVRSEEGLYTFYRMDQEGRVLQVVFNPRKEKQTIGFQRFGPILDGHESATDILGEGTLSKSDSLKVMPRSARVLLWGGE